MAEVDGIRCSSCNRIGPLKGEQVVMGMTEVGKGRGVTDGKEGWRDGENLGPWLG